MSYSTEVVRQVWDNENGVKMTVGPDRDGLGCVEVYVPESDAKAVEYYGKVSLVMNPKQARAIARAILACADELDPEVKS